MSNVLIDAHGNVWEFQYTPEISAEIKRRIDVAVFAYAYEIEDDPLVNDEEFDRLARSIRPEIGTGRAELDRFFREEFAPHTGQWVHRHPEKDKLRDLAEFLRRRKPLRAKRTPTMTTEAPVAEQPVSSALEAAVKAYRDLRDERAALKKEFDDIDKGLKERMERLENALLVKMDGLGVSQLKTSAGMAYVQTTHKPTCGDWEAFYGWVLETGRLDCLQKRLASNTVNDFVTESGELPPGCSMVSERVVSIRK